MNDKTRYRKWLTEPGESLIINRDLGKLENRVNEMLTWFDETDDGVPICYTTVSTIPMPIYTEKDKDDVRRFKNIVPNQLWHPLFWLPKKISEKYLLQFSKDEEYPELDEMWQLRVLFELNAAGLYNHKTGEWLDVLYSAGIDTQTPDGLDRLKRFLAGGKDDILDTFTVEPLLSKHPIKSDRAFDAMYEVFVDINGGSKALTAKQLIDTFQELIKYARNGENVVNDFYYWASWADILMIGTSEELYTFVNELDEQSAASNEAIIKNTKNIILFLQHIVDDRKENLDNLTNAVKAIPLEYI
jgi:hypothetical protein